MKFYHIADVHLGRITDIGTRWEKTGYKEIYDGFLAFVDYAEVNPVDFIFVTGDLFDHVPNAEELRFVDRAFARLANTIIIYVTGEADYLLRGSALWKYKFVSNTYLLNCETFNNNVKGENAGERTSYADEIVDCIHFPKHNVDIYGVCQFNDHNSRTDLDESYARNPKRINVLLGHGGADDVMPFYPADLKGKYDYVGMGHFHEYTEYKEYGVYYPGSLEPLGQEEQGVHGFIKGYADGLICSAKLVPFSSRQYETIEIDADETTTNSVIFDMLDKMCGKNKNHIYEIKINRSPKCYTDFDAEQIVKKYRVIKLQGARYPKPNLVKLEGLNIENVFGKTLRKLRKSDSQFFVEAEEEYAEFMLRGIWGYDDLEMIPKLASRKEADTAHEETMKALEKKQNKIISIKKALDDKQKRIEKKLENYANTEGSLNTARAQEKELKHAFDEIRFEDEQVNKKYKRGRLKFILAFDMPIAVGFVIFFVMGALDAFAMREWDAYYKVVVTIAVSFILVTAICYVYYNSSQKYRKKHFNTPIPAEEHVKNGRRMLEVEEKLVKLVDDVAKYESMLQEKKRLERELAIAGKNALEIEKLGNQIDLILSI